MTTLFRTILFFRLLIFAGLIVMANALSAEASSISFAGLKEDIENKDIRSTEQLLKYFGQDPKYRTLLHSAVYERESFALHFDQVSPEFPRILLGADDLVMHFTGHPDSPGHNFIELAELNAKEGRFSFNLIHFFGDAKKPEFIEDASLHLTIEKMEELTEQTGGGVSNCTSCHSNGILEGPPFDNLNWSPRGRLSRVFGSQNGKIQKGSQEYSDFQKFLGTLSDSKQGSLYQLIPKSFQRDSEGNIVFPENPVQSFTDHTYELANRKVVAGLRKFSAYENYQYMLAAALLDCPGLDQFMPPASKSLHEAKLQKMYGVSYSGEKIPLVNLDPAILEPDYLARLKGQNTISVKDFLDHTRLHVIEALKIAIWAVDQRTVFSVPSSDETTYLQPQYLSRLAKLAYILNGNYPELPPLAFVGVNEVIDKFGYAAVTYRLDGGNQRLDQLLAADFGPLFLKEHPRLDLFKNHEMSVQTLKVPLKNYCRRLSKESYSAFRTKPLIGTDSIN